MRLIKYTDSYKEEWDSWLKHSPCATFLHSRQFLSYHKQRFEDCSVLIFDEEDKLLAVFAAAFDQNDRTKIISHQGITYAGLLTVAKADANLHKEIFQELMSFYRKMGVSSIIYKAVPDCFKKVNFDNDLYALQQLNARLIRRDLNCVIDLRRQLFLNSKDLSNIRNKVSKAKKNGLKIIEDLKYLQEFYDIICQNLSLKYQIKPVHSLKELMLLQELFPENILFRAVVKDSQIIAGAFIFQDNYFYHTQYLANSELGKQFSALDYLIHMCISEASQKNKDYFSFGISTEQQGLYFNQGLYASKAKHGGLGMVHDFYQLDF
ncbi:MAG: family N-acetyltransferase [Gammaproteobacteria bacterium]|jgi:hypothetical protein|nr:family N-acetyltransferase [Gammaproteobacteria bacterium]